MKKENKASTINPAKFTENDWSMVYTQLSKHGIYPATISTDKKGGMTIMIPSIGISAPVQKPQFIKIGKSAK